MIPGVRRRVLDRGSPFTEPRPVYHEEVSIEALLIPAIAPSAAAELFVAAVLGWIGFNIHRTVRDPRTPPAAGVLLDLSLGLVTALVFLFSASLEVFF